MGVLRNGERQESPCWKQTRTNSQLPFNDLSEMRELDANGSQQEAYCHQGVEGGRGVYIFLQ